MMLLLQFIALFCASLLFLPGGLCFNHWVVTEDGKIEYQVRGMVHLPLGTICFTSTCQCKCTAHQGKE